MNFIFDLYGTLIDVWTNEKKRQPWVTLCTELGASRLFWRRLRREYITLCKSKSKGESHEIELLDVFRDMLTKHGKDRSDAERLALAFRQASTERLCLFDGVKEMLYRLRETGAGVYLLSNAQACFTRHELEICGLLPLFDDILLSSDVGAKKPSTEIFNIALSRFGISAGECVYVGNDMRDDVLGASRSGIESVYIKTEQSGNYPELEPLNPTYTANSHAHLSELLLSLAVSN